MSGMVKVGDLLRRLSWNYWTVPGAMVAFSIGLSFLLPWVDHMVGDAGSIVPDWLFGGGPDAARVLLTTTAGSMITVAALAFSITMVGLSTTSQQFGPRLIRNFIADRGYQVVLGTFLANFIYCLLVSRTVRSGSDPFVPYISVAVGIALAISGVCVLIYFIHHAASSLRAENLVAASGRELRAAIEDVFPPAPDETLGTDDATPALPEGFGESAHEVLAWQSGYIQTIDQDRLTWLAQDNDLVFRLRHRVGQFIVQNQTLIEAWPSTRVDEALVGQVSECFTLGAMRSPRRNVEAAVDQLVEIAVRSLSPGINDPETAIACLDQLTDAMRLVGERQSPPALVVRGGEVRLVISTLNYEHLLDDCFSRIRRHGRGDFTITLRLLEGYATLAAGSDDETRLKALLHEAEAVWHSAQGSIPDQDDLGHIESRFRAIEKTVEQACGQTPTQRG